MVKQGGLVLVFVLSTLSYFSTANICSNNPCANEGICKSYGEYEYKCSCKYGWSGNNCELDVDDCKPDSCFNGGQCEDKQDGKYECHCPQDYIGPKCEYKNPCVNNPCKNNAACIPLLTGQMNCNCSKPYTGEFCDISPSCPKNMRERRQICSRNGECKSNAGLLYCDCDPGYSGSKCEYKSKGSINIGCQNGYCFNGGTCFTREDGNFHCTCNNGFRGSRCDIKEISIKKSSTGNELKANNPAPIEKVSLCNLECKSLKNNGKCEQRCNTEKCGYDGGDCDPWKKCNIRKCKDVFRNEYCDPECNNVNCLFDGQDCDSSSCKNHLFCSKVYQNNICNEVCNNPQCGFDGGDCQGKQSESFFSNVGNNQKCSNKKREFELELILLTTEQDFLHKKASFLQSLGSALRMVLTISQIKLISFNFTSALLIKLKIHPTECIIYGGQCFSSLEQISNFIKAGMNDHSALSLPFKVANVDSKTIYSVVPKKIKSNSYLVVLISMGSSLIISLIVIFVLLRDKWGRLRTKVKTTGVWTPSEGYSTSTSSINSNHKLSTSLQLTNTKLDERYLSQYDYENDVFKYTNMQVSALGKKIEPLPDNRKRKLDIIDTNGNALSFQVISDHLQKRDGVNPVNSSQTKLINIINENAQPKPDTRSRELEVSSTNLGSYVNDDGESLLHIASRMNCGANIIRKLYNIAPTMLYSTDEWGRTPLATSVASDSFESVEQLLVLEKQSRKEYKQNKIRNGQQPLCGTIESPVKKTTGLIESVKLNSKEMINLLLDEGCPVNVLDSNGRSVVHWAAMFNNVELLERLHHMKIFQKLVDLKDNDELSPLYLAASEGSFEAAKFIIEYIRKHGIKIDQIYPCPKAIAIEKGFSDIEALINEAELPNLYSEKVYKRIKLKDQKMLKKLSNLNSPTKPLEIINEYKEYSTDSIKLDKNSPNGIDSLESCLLDMYSLEDSSINNILDSCPIERSNYSSFKPQDNNCHSYFSNTSSSDMSPPLLNLKHPPGLNGYNCQSDQFDPTFYLSPSHPSHFNNIHMGSNYTDTNETSSGIYHSEPLSRIKQYQHRSLNMMNLPSINCPL